MKAAVVNDNMMLFVAKSNVCKKIALTAATLLGDSVGWL